MKIVELDNDPELEKNINDCADRNNLGIRNIKQILKYVIRESRTPMMSVEHLIVQYDF